MVEKPPERGAFNLAVIGRYILTPDFDIIRNASGSKWRVRLPMHFKLKPARAGYRL